MTDKLSKISVWILSLARPLLPKIFIKVEQDNGEGGKSQRNNYINKEIVQEDEAHENFNDEENPGNQNRIRCPEKLFHLLDLALQLPMSQTSATITAEYEAFIAFYHTNL